ncbi:hypothetical protein PUV47_04320 [Pseudovibrio exalbescens]|uniref:hypothetical protein n=2 Tax=Stappiaceae TaxID=2821832 RepID=UPI002365D4CA|nr:hypothetical protein [Pseudovibrio exalbescens]MDD7909131.1 hypothetical protein [Pseudovibrio exalbescens]
MVGFWASQSAETQGQEAINGIISEELQSLLASRDLTMAERAQTAALNSNDIGGLVEWTSRRSEAEGSVRSGPIYFVNETQCRDYSHAITIEQQKMVFNGAACKTGKNWTLLN